MKKDCPEIIEKNISRSLDGQMDIISAVGLSLARRLMPRMRGTDVGGAPAFDVSALSACPRMGCPHIHMRPRDMVGSMS